MNEKQQTGLEPDELDRDNEQFNQGVTHDRTVDVTDGLARALQAPAAPVGDPLASLARLITEPPRVPEIGAAASEGMRQAFEKVAEEIESVARDGVERANQNLQEALSYAEVIRQSGELLCGRIEAEAVRALQISRVMREARSSLAEPPRPEVG